jgi:hypothetical protein
MESQRTTKRSQRHIPRGVIVIASLLLVGAFFSAGSMLMPTQTLQAFNLPRSLLLVGALATGVLGYGLLRLRRWAWAAMLSFTFVNAYFLVLGTLVNGRVQLTGLGILAAVAVYFLLPGVRAAFLDTPDNGTATTPEHQES